MCTIIYLPHCPCRPPGSHLPFSSPSPRPTLLAPLPIPPVPERPTPTPPARRPRWTSGAGRSRGQRRRISGKGSATGRARAYLRSAPPDLVLSPIRHSPITPRPRAQCPASRSLTSQLLQSFPRFKSIPRPLRSLTSPSPSEPPRLPPSSGLPQVACPSPCLSPFNLSSTDDAHLAVPSHPPVSQVTPAPPRAPSRHVHVHPLRVSVDLTSIPTHTPRAHPLRAPLHALASDAPARRNRHTPTGYTPTHSLLGRSARDAHATHKARRKVVEARAWPPGAGLCARVTPAAPQQPPERAPEPPLPCFSPRLLAPASFARPNAVPTRTRTRHPPAAHVPPPLLRCRPSASARVLFPALHPRPRPRVRTPSRARPSRPSARTSQSAPSPAPPPQPHKPSPAPHTYTHAVHRHTRTRARVDQRRRQYHTSQLRGVEDPGLAAYLPRTERPQENRSQTRRGAVLTRRSILCTAIGEDRIG